MNLIILGPQGSGKGTQAKLLAQKYGLTHISTGELLRKEIASGSAFGQVLKEKLDRGDLVTDAELFSILEKAPLAGRQGFILDGTPRNLSQAKELESVLAKVGVDIDRVILLTLLHEESIARLQKRAKIEHRQDDNPEAIQKRLDLYNHETVPVIEYYRSQGKLIEVDGRPDVQTIFADICHRLEVV